MICLLSLFLSEMYGGVSQKLHDALCHDRLNAEAALRIQLCSVKSDIKEICKNVTQCHSSTYF